MGTLTLPCQDPASLRRKLCDVDVNLEFDELASRGVGSRLAKFPSSLTTPGAWHRQAQTEGR